VPFGRAMLDISDAHAVRVFESLIGLDKTRKQIESETNALVVIAT